MAVVKFSDPFAYRQIVDLPDRDVATLLDPKEKFGELFKVGFVVPERMRTDVTHIFEMLQKIFSFFGEYHGRFGT